MVTRDEPGGLARQREELIPIPDPTTLTLKLVKEALEGLESKLDLRFDSHVSQLNLTREILVAERNGMIAKVEVTLEQYDKRAQQYYDNNRHLIQNYATVCADATAKLEANFTKQLDGQSSLINSRAGNLEARIADLKDRMTAIEARGGGQQSMWGYVAAAIGLAVSITIAAVAIINLIAKT